MMGVYHILVCCGVYYLHLDEYMFVIACSPAEGGDSSHVTALNEAACFYSAIRVVETTHVLAVSNEIAWCQCVGKMTVELVGIFWIHLSIAASVLQAAAGIACRLSAAFLNITPRFYIVE